ncbi:MAG: hypothetical protein HY698_08965 [Deltaproteobacteria bacterium]|nr:hypothetical protein [Deltaproteobacteria bacterium]
MRRVDLLASPCILGLALLACNENATSVDAESIQPPGDAGPWSDGGQVPGNDSGLIPLDAGRRCEGGEVEVGTGATSFEPVSDGDTVFLYRGPQGGYMIYLGVRAKGLDPSDVHVCYRETFKDTGQVFGEGCWRVRLVNDLGGGVYERVGIWGEVDPMYFTTPGRIRGKDAVVRTTVTDKSGCQGADEWWVHVSEEPGR